MLELAHAHAAQAELLGDVRELFGLAAADPVAEDDDRVFRLREAVEGVFEGHRGARGFDGLHDALLEGGLRGPVRDHGARLGGILAGGSHWTVEARGTRRHREDAFDFIS
jgi:hypothetical protein